MIGTLRKGKKINNSRHKVKPMSRGFYIDRNLKSILLNKPKNRRECIQYKDINGNIENVSSSGKTSKYLHCNKWSANNKVV
jgi:hypothetical protein